MKKALLLIAFAGLFFTSCKKEYTCECTTTSSTTTNGVKTNNPSTTATAQTGKVKEDDAKASCEKGSTSSTVGDADDNVSVTVSCKIK
jgi:hypothetical protein